MSDGKAQLKKDEVALAVKIFRVVGAVSVLSISFNMVACLARNNFSDAIALVPFGILVTLVFVSIFICREEFKTSLRQPQVRAMYHVLFQAFIGFLLLTFLLYLAGHRFHTRFDWAANSARALSEETREALKELAEGKEALELVYLEGPAADEEQAQHIGRVRMRVQDLLREYEAQARSLAAGSINFSVLRVLEDPVRLDELGKRIGVKSFTSDMNEGVVLLKGEHSKLVLMRDLFETVVGGAVPKEHRVFRGEATFTSAIRMLLSGKPLQVRFLKGHGEQPAQSITAFSGILARENAVWEEFDLTSPSALPADMDLLVACGPRKKFSDQELKHIADYLENGGSLLLFVDPVLTTHEALPQEACGLEDLLKKYGIHLRQDLMTRSFQLDVVKNLVPVDHIPAFPNPKSASPLLTSLRTERFPVMFSYPCAVQAQETSDKVDGVRTEILLQTAAYEHAGMKNLAANPSSPGLKNGDPGEDGIKGQVPLAALAEARQAGGDGGDSKPKGRVMVVASSRMATDPLVLRSTGNQIFLRTALLWLFREDEYSSKVQTQKSDAPLAVLDPSDAGLLFSILGLGLPLVFMFAGVIVWAVRKN